MWFLLLNLNFGSTKECLEIPRKPLFFSPIPSSPTPHYCVSHKYFFIKNRHSSLKGLLRIKKEQIEKNIKKLWNMRVVFLYFLLSSLLYHKNRIMCVCMYTRTHVWVRTHACKPVGRGLQYIRRVTQPLQSLSFSHSRGLSAHPPLLLLWLFQLDFFVLISRLVNFILKWFFSTWAMGI